MQFNEQVLFDYLKRRFAEPGTHGFVLSVIARETGFDDVDFPGKSGGLLI